MDWNTIWAGIGSITAIVVVIGGTYDKLIAQPRNDKMMELHEMIKADATVGNNLANQLSLLEQKLVFLSSEIATLNKLPTRVDQHGVDIARIQEQQIHQNEMITQLGVFQQQTFLKIDELIKEIFLSRK